MYLNKSSITTIISPPLLHHVSVSETRDKCDCPNTTNITNTTKHPQNNFQLTVQQKQLKIIYYKTHKTGSTTIGSISNLELYVNLEIDFNLNYIF